MIIESAVKVNGYSGRKLVRKFSIDSIVVVMIEMLEKSFPGRMKEVITSTRKYCSFDLRKLNMGK